MDSDTIEKTAVNAVESAILNAGNFTPLFNKNDTVPSWDGEIIVYKGKSKAKSNIVDVIPVQIKGTTVDKREDGGLRYPVKVADLKNYLNCKSGAVLYFVVFIEEGEEEPKKTIYYLKLLPFDLKYVLSYSSEQESVSLHFHPFPVKKMDIVCLLYDVARDMKRQRAHIAADGVTLDSVINEQKVPVLTLSRTVIDEDVSTTPFSLLGQDFYFYAERQDNLQQPVMHGRIDGISLPVSCAVSVNGVKYYDGYKKVEYVNQQILEIGRTIKFVFPKCNENVMQLCVNLSGNLSDDIKDLSFLLELFQHKKLQLGKMEYPCDLQNGQCQRDEIEAFRQQLEVFQLIQRLMTAMDVACDFDFAQLKEEQWDGLCRLYGFIVEGNKARIESLSAYGVIEPELGNLRILLFAIADKQAEHCYEIRSFSDTRNIVLSPEGDQTTPFVGLSVEQIMHVDNIKYENLFLQLETIPLSAPHVKGVTHLFYKMLLAYDRSGDKRTDILKSAIQLAEWLEAHDQYSDRAYKTLNKLEAIKRSRPLNEQESEELFSITENAELPPIYRSLAYVLLGEQKSAERIFKQVPVNIQETVREYPIFRFWQGNSTCRSDADREKV